MTRYFNDSTDYLKRRELRSEYEQWLATMEIDYLVTLSFPQDTRIASARPMLSHWFARIDSHYLGRAWSRTSSNQRSFGIAFPENMATNLHHHCLVRLPDCARDEPYEAAAATLQRAWHRVAPRGTCDVAKITNLTGAARYVVKQAVRPGYLDQFVLASEFHSRRSGDTGPSNYYRPGKQARRRHID